MHGSIKRKQSAVSSGRRLFAVHTPIDANVHSRRWHDVYTQSVRDAGGDAAISDAHRGMCRRVATLTTVLEQREQVFVSTGKMTRDETQEYQSLTRTLSLLLKKLHLTTAATDADEDDQLDPLSYVNGGRKSVRRERISSDEEDD